MTKLLRDNMILCLALAIASAVLFPQLGVSMRQPTLNGWPTSPVHAMLAFLMFTAGVHASMRTDWRTLGWLAHFAASRLCVIGAILLLDQLLVPTSLGGCVAASIFVLLLPSAGSSSGWALQTASSAGVALTMILTTTLASAVLTPLALQGIATSVENPVALQLRALADGFSMAFTIPYLLVPSLAGMIVGARQLVNKRKRVTLHTRLAQWVPIVILLLNYANASVGLSQLDSLSQPRTVFLLTVGTSGVLFLTAWAMSRLGSVPTSRRAATFSTGMSNTGLGLMVAVSAMPNQTAIHLTIIVFTFSQHVWAAVYSRLADRRRIDVRPHAESLATIAAMLQLTPRS